nr:tryptophan transporter [uncultured Peptostreptococcus sp.]
MRNSKTKTMILNAILLGIGFIAHQIFPAIAGGITPDLTLVMLFCIMVINRDDYKSCLVAGIISGIFSALATKFPSGQVPNMVDKLVTVNVMFILMKTMYALPLMNKLNEKKDQIIIFVMTLVGTFVSGLVFLVSAAAMVGLPASLMSLIVAVVLPSIVLNVLASMVLFNIVKLALKRSSYKIG